MPWERKLRTVAEAPKLNLPSDRDSGSHLANVGTVDPHVREGCSRCQYGGPSLRRRTERDPSCAARASSNKHDLKVPMARGLTRAFEHRATLPRSWQTRITSVCMAQRVADLLPHQKDQRWDLCEKNELNSHWHRRSRAYSGLAAQSTVVLSKHVLRALQKDTATSPSSPATCRLGCASLSPALTLPDDPNLERIKKGKRERHAPLDPMSWCRC